MNTPDDDQLKLAKYSYLWKNTKNCITAGVYRKIYLKLYFELYIVT